MSSQVALQASNPVVLSQTPIEIPKAVLESLVGADASVATQILEKLDVDTAARVLRAMNPPLANAILTQSSEAFHLAVLERIPQYVKEQWQRTLTYPEGSVGRLMDPPVALFAPSTGVGETIEALRSLVKEEFITYCYVVDGQRRLQGVVVMRELLFASPEQPLEQVMLRNPYAMRAGMQLMDAMREVLTRHFPVYPVVDEEGHLVGLVRGHRLFEAQAVEISTQAGRMVGVEREERLSTPWKRSFKFRHPWLQLNLLTAFVAGAVVSFFQDTVNHLVILAAFLPVLAGQSGNTGCQALAVTLRGMTLGELKQGDVAGLLAKEALLGMFNGLFVGLSAGAGMYLLAVSQGNPHALTLSFIVLLAMTGSCVVSGLSGALVPLGLKKLGADPATASSIFLTTATDVASMGLLLSLATWILL